MLGVGHRLLRFVRELDRGSAVMSGEVAPGAYDSGHVGSGGSEEGSSLRAAVLPLRRLLEYLRAGGGPRLAVFALLLAMVLWGSVFVATKEVMGEAGPFTVAAGRFAIGFAVLFPLARRKGFRVKHIFRRTYLLFGFMGVFLAYGLQNLSLVFSSASDATLVIAAQPAAVVMMGMLFLRERLPIARLLGIGLAMIGVLLVSGVAFSSGGGNALLGNALMVGSVLAYGAYAAQGRVLGVDQPASLITAASFGAGLLFLMPVAAGEMYLNGIPELGIEGWLILLYLGVSTTAVTFLLLNYALRHLEAGAAGLYFNLLPVTGLAFAILFGSRVGPIELVGGGLAIAGVLLGDYLVRRRERRTSVEASWAVSQT